jgi:hypothetical protein
LAEKKCIDETVGTARERAGDWGTCIVVKGERVILGCIFRSELEGDPNARVGEVMRPGTSRRPAT